MTGNKLFRETAVLSVSTLSILSSTAVSPALAGIKDAFPGIPDATIQLVMAIPVFCIIPACFICRPLVSRFGEKPVLLAGASLYVIGGSGAALMPTFGSMLAFRALLGLACGMTIPMAQILISSNFKGKERDNLTAYSASASYLMGIAASYLVGQLAKRDWRLCFLVYLAAIVVIALNSQIHLNGPAEERKAKRKLKPSVRAWVSILVMAFVNLAFYAFTSSIALFMREEGLGDSGTSGIVMSLFMTSGFLMGLLVPSLNSRLGSLTKPLGFLLMGSGFLTLRFSYSTGMAVLSGLLTGASYSVLYASGFSEIRELSRDREENTALITLMTAAMFAGQASSLYVLKGLEAVFHASGYRFRFMLLSLALMTASALSALLAARRRNEQRTIRQSSGALRA